MKSFRLISIAFLSGLILLLSSVAFAEEAQGPSSEGVQAKIEAFKGEQAAMRGELEALKAAYANATDAERKAAMEQWRSENADRILAQKELMAQIRNELQADFKSALGEKIRARKNAREQMRENLANMGPIGPDEKAQIRQEIRERRRNSQD